ncbi:MAG: AzlD domain-containing protein [Oscillospiraceae bacterium]|nr:AzlD domain-containing protein [Oscillospiraceae bacterium]
MTVKLVVYIAVMAGVTYLIRMLPFVIFRKKIESKFIKDFLYYVPYAVLGAMTIPAVIYSTDNIIAAAVGTLTAVILAFKNKSLLVVAIFACAAAFAADIVMNMVL